LVKVNIEKTRKICKIYFILSLKLYPPRTGGLRYNYEISREFEERGFNVKVIDEDVFPEYFLSFLWWESPFIIWHLMSTPNRAIIIQDSAPHKTFILYNIFLRAFSNIKLITVFHHAIYTLKSNLFLKILAKTIESLMMKISHRIITNSEYSKKQLIEMGVPAEKIRIVNPAVDLPVRTFTERKKLNDPPVLFFLGYISKRKGLIYLIEALNMMKERDFRVVIAGSKEMEPPHFLECQNLISEFQLEDRIEFPGMIPREEVDYYFETSDIFILPSLHEGYGMVLKEAASFGIPIITTDVGAIPEVVKDGESALLIPPRDSSALRDAIIRILEDDELRKRIAKGAFESVDFSYNWKRMRETAFNICIEILR